jgi:hypothetical protein
MAKKLRKKIVYTIEAKLIFDPEEPIDISEYLDNLRGIGVAEVVNVELMDQDDLEEDEDE